MEIVTIVLARDALWQELNFLIGYFSEKGMLKCEVLFGYSWGIYYYDDQPWKEEEIDLLSLSNLIHKMEQNGLGTFGGSDMIIFLPGIKFNFCHESDIHIEFENGNFDAPVFLDRWKSSGYLQ
ncbi:hypothetical protein [Vogesella sp. AC12]|uniref:hypothetical protein n=1 Tax=Vogesella sp. AC12 TaxID=2950550 RepID=UPI00210EAD00|nr:hypothetical protein [Vogesella sp. AC12]MCQ4145398.1 hypothetical protein [Vogesella sp. AC12]